MSNFGDILMIGTVLGKLFIAAILGGIIGWERHRRGTTCWPEDASPCMYWCNPDDAGFRTYFCPIPGLQK